MKYDRLAKALRAAGVSLAPGLSSGELRAVEQRYGFAFPPDLSALLGTYLPFGRGWINWRSAKKKKIECVLAWPYEGICFDIEHNDFWPEQWGARPTNLGAACVIAKEKVLAAPRLVPIVGHRYIPDRPHEAGNPVFSVYQTDIIYYGSDLDNYFENEYNYYFGTPKYQLHEPIRRIEFWSRLVDLNNAPPTEDRSTQEFP